MNLAIGFFDGVHMGHRRILAGADAVFTFANHPMSVLNPLCAPPLLMDVDERIAMLATIGAKVPRAVRAMRFTLRFAAMSPEEFADFLRREYPDISRIHCGGNWRFGANGAGTPAKLRSLGFDVKVVRYARHDGEIISSTRIRRALADGEIELANAMLGRRFATSGRIVRGKGVGRTLGAPTLNLVANPPVRYGVYVVDTPHGPGVANFGVAPTMGRRAWKFPVLEVHLLRPEPFRIGRGAVKLRVEFVSFIRPEIAFASRAALRRQIAMDLEAAVRMSPSVASD